MTTGATIKNRSHLPPFIRHSPQFPTNPTASSTIERLLERDRNDHHCQFGVAKYHNHLSHHLLAAYDLGASASLLEAIYQLHAEKLLPIDTVDRANGIVKRLDLSITESNWTEFLGKEVYYAPLLKFFSIEVEAYGARGLLDLKFVFSPDANKDGVDMMRRFFAGIFHPLIQVGYGLEFQSDAIVAQGLAQAATHTPARLQQFHPSFEPARNLSSLPLLEILRQLYESPILKPAMPYNPDTSIPTHFHEACEDGRSEEIRRLATLWWSPSPNANLESDLKVKLEEITWFATLLLVGSNKLNRKPRLDFYLVHILNASQFLPFFLGAFLSNALLIIEVCGRPRINIEVTQTYTDTPAPPGATVNGAGDVLTTESDAGHPWAQVIAEAIHAPDSHTVKVIRTLFYAAQRFGHTQPGKFPGAFRPDNGEETHVGIGELDGTLFIRTAGMVMQTMGWVCSGQKAGSFDKKGLGWDDAWNDEDLDG
ncbi:hypothetical protein BD779DRAFT_1664309 [Infundibulicybe gibba]|nr:hypothetical protein BD779DRAFT_1664309 [Infundibulicybe gibba]